jgi:hypothetical protein
VTYHGRLANLEHPHQGGALPDPRRTKLELRDGELAWTLAADGAPTTRETAGALFLNEFRFSDNRSIAPGALFAEHGTRGHALGADAFPHVIHPTEVQLLRLEDDGALVFHAYDREERIAPSSQPRAFSCSYYFLSSGQRQHREIDVTVEDLRVVSRGALRTTERALPWGTRELAWWLSA